METVCPAYSILAGAVGLAQTGLEPLHPVESVGFNYAKQVNAVDVMAAAPFTLPPSQTLEAATGLKPRHPYKTFTNLLCLPYARGSSIPLLTICLPKLFAALEPRCDEQRGGTNVPSDKAQGTRGAS
jgi:hypothetical protein